MALPRNPPLLKVLGEASARWTRRADDAQRSIDDAASRDISSGEIRSILDTAVNDIVYFAEVAAVPGIGAYAVDQYGADVTGDFPAFVAALEGVRDWILSNFPTSNPGGYLQAETFDAEGKRVPRYFTPAQTAGLRTALQAVVDAVVAT